ncbi:hypothetical protein JCM10908_005683 [Rhodotorula pacifica]|uniref:gluconeogenesis transcription factor RDS2 n=1 Tax=Rhodotorula pacifica TaxID=1495444 RepID=UPI00317E7742
MPTPTPIAPAPPSTVARSSLPPLAPRPPLPGSSTTASSSARVSSPSATAAASYRSPQQQQQQQSGPSSSSTTPASSSAPASAPVASTSTSTTPSASNPAPPPPRKKRRNKVDSACRFCRKSHMQCSGERPCARCIKREIAHLCTDAPLPPPTPASSAPPSSAPATDITPKAESPTLQQQQQPYGAGLYGPPPPAVTISTSAAPDPINNTTSSSLGLVDFSTAGNTSTTAGGGGGEGGRHRAGSGSGSLSPGQQANSTRALQQQQSPANGIAQLLAGAAGGTDANSNPNSSTYATAAAANGNGNGNGGGQMLGRRESHGVTGGAGGGAGSSLAGAGTGSATQQQQQQHLYTPDFNMAMLDLANDGLGSGLGLDMTSTGEGEFHGLGLSEFLASLDAPLFTTTAAAATTTSSADPSPNLIITSHLHANSNSNNSNNLVINTNDTGLSVVSPGARNAELPGGGGGAAGGGGANNKSLGPSVPGSPVNKTERFLLTAADQKDGSRSDRLARVIHAKFEAGLLRPYNHVAGYTRLMKWMADNMSANSRQRTLHTLSEFRPTFRAIASGLTDLDLVFIEEAFERLLLDYDRVFSSMGIPSCLWRRTGEIYKGNKEFAALVGVPIEDLQGGKLAIYELMAEESAVNYWEKYGNIAFDVGQKAVLTSCVLINQSILSRKRKKAGADKRKVPDDAMVNACFSFTIRRDSYGIPSMIVGNFIKL